MATQGEGHRTTSTSSTSGPEEDGTHTTSVEKYERGDGCDTTERTETVTTRSTLPNGARQVEHTKRQSCAVDSSTTSEDEVSKSHVTHTSYTTSEKTRSETTDPPGVGVGVQGTEEGKMQSLSVERISGSKMTLIKIEAATPEAQKQMDEFLRSKGATLTLSAPAADRPPSPGSSSTSSSDAKKSKSIPSLTHQTSHQQQQQQGEVQVCAALTILKNIPSDSVALILRYLFECYYYAVSCCDAGHLFLLVWCVYRFRSCQWEPSCRLTRLQLAEKQRPFLF